MVEAIGERSDQEDSDEIALRVQMSALDILVQTEGMAGIGSYYPDWRSQQRQLHACQFRVRGLDDHRAVVLDTDTHAHNPKIHQ